MSIWTSISYSFLSIIIKLLSAKVSIIHRSIYFNHSLGQQDKSFEEENTNDCTKKVIGDEKVPSVMGAMRDLPMTASFHIFYNYINIPQKNACNDNLWLEDQVMKN